MAFNSFMLNQLSNPPEALHIEILEILNATSYAITSLEIYKLSKVALNSRDISLEIQKTLKPKGLVEIDKKERRDGTAQEVAYWKITQIGRDFLASKSKVLPDDIEPDYEVPVFGQPSATEQAVIEIEKIIDAPTKTTIASDRPDYSDKPKAYQILKYIEANPWKTNKEIKAALNLKTSIDGYISPYLAFVVIDKIEIGEEAGMRIFKLLKPVEEFYHHRKPVTEKQLGAAKNEATSIPQQPQEDTATDTVEAQRPAAEPQRVAMPEIQTATAETLQSEVGNEFVESVKSQFRCAYTNDCCLLLFLGGHPETVELDEFETTELIEFISSIITPIGVSI